MVDRAEPAIRLANECKATPSQVPRILSKEQKPKDAKLQQLVCCCHHELSMSLFTERQTRGVTVAHVSPFIAPSESCVQKYLRDAREVQ